MEPYYADAFATIYLGDCLEVLPHLGTFDIAFADPPYNVGMDYGDGFDDARPDAEYVLWCDVWFRLLREHAGRVFVTPGHGNLPAWHDRKPSGIACWYKPGNTQKAGIFQWCEWEPVFVWGGRISGSDVWKATLNPTFKRDVGHPCPKPELLVRRIIAASKATSLLDPFLGSGTSLVAAKAMGIPAAGIERSERFCEVAARRLTQEVLNFGA